jgi:hypothetical protein
MLMFKKTRKDSVLPSILLLLLFSVLEVPLIECHFVRGSWESMISLKNN